MVITFIHSNNRQDQPRVQQRCRGIAGAVNRTGVHSAHLLDLPSFLQKTAHAGELCAASDLLVIHRYLFEPVLQALYTWKARDKAVILDIDEAFDLAPSGSPSHAFWHSGQRLSGVYPDTASPGEPPPLEQLKWGLRVVDGITVTSQRLADTYWEYASVHHLPDYLNTDAYLALRRSNPDGNFWIGLGGPDLTLATLRESGLLPALEQVCARRSQVRVLLADVEGLSAADVNIPAGQLRLERGIPPEAWPGLLSGLHLGLAPVCTSQEMRRSPVRLLEYMAMKIPWIGSTLPPQNELGRYGTLVNNDAGSWERAILEAVDHIDSYLADAQGEPFLYALSQDVNENVGKILAIYQSVLRN